jgi:hypothetical protein
MVMVIRKRVKYLIVSNPVYVTGIKRYNISKNLTRKNRISISYKITKLQVKTALELLKQNEQLTMSELVMELKQK